MPHNAYIRSIRDREFKAEMEFAAASRRENITLARVSPSPVSGHSKYLSGAPYPNSPDDSRPTYGVKGGNPIFKWGTHCQRHVGHCSSIVIMIP